MGVTILYGFVPLSHKTETPTLTLFAYMHVARRRVYNVSLLTAPVARMGKRHDVGVRVGTSMTLVALGTVSGRPIFGAIHDATAGFKFVGSYAGTQGSLAFPALACLILSASLGFAVMLACAFMITTRVSILWGKVYPRPSSAATSAARPSPSRRIPWTNYQTTALHIGYTNTDTITSCSSRTITDIQCHTPLY